ncbi:hypothetical protein E2C01_025695 [Portunus trituberculatus]|uniref:Uncharacterized protein n=1 Tax=Portunus trituberculatus TaxID=210409 RepID=A0A5B7EG70_PORTR|nr:hypothetical protein [Portunus trituberculatus]
MGTIRQAAQKRDETTGRRQAPENGAGRRVWAVELAVQHREFRPLLKEEVNRPFLIVERPAAVDHLTTVGFQGIVLADLGKVEKLTKVFITRYDRELDQEMMLINDENVVWAKRHMINKQ